MRILITGGAGFIGSHLAEEHLKRGDTVTVLDDFSTGSADNLKAIKKDITLVKGSVLNASMVSRYCAVADGVYHLAAVVGVEKYMLDPSKCFDDNVQGTRNVVQAVKVSKSKLIFASSSEVYGAPSSDVLVEGESPCYYGQGPRWSYAHSKAGGELLVRSISRNALSVRLFNVCGPRQSLGYCMSNFVDRAKRNESLEVYGTGTQERTIGYVGDVVECLAEMMHSKKVTGGEYNVGGNIRVSMSDLAKAVLENVNPARLEDGKNAIQLVPYSKKYARDPQDPAFRTPSLEKIEKAIGWKPSTGLDDIIKATVNGALVGAK